MKVSINERHALWLAAFLAIALMTGCPALDTGAEQYLRANFVDAKMGGDRSMLLMFGYGKKSLPYFAAIARGIEESPEKKAAFMALDAHFIDQRMRFDDPQGANNLRINFMAFKSYLLQKEYAEASEAEKLVCLRKMFRHGLMVAKNTKGRGDRYAHIFFYSILTSLGNVCLEHGWLPEEDLLSAYELGRDLYGFAMMYKPDKPWGTPDFNYSRQFFYVFQQNFMRLKLVTIRQYMHGHKVKHGRYPMTLVEGCKKAEHSGLVIDDFAKPQRMLEYAVTKDGSEWGVLSLGCAKQPAFMPVAKRTSFVPFSRNRFEPVLHLGTASNIWLGSDAEVKFIELRDKRKTVIGGEQHKLREGEFMGQKMIYYDPPHSYKCVVDKEPPQEWFDDAKDGYSRCVKYYNEHIKE